MARLARDLKAYLRAVFLDTSRRVWTFFDALGVLFLLYPGLAQCITSNARLVRSIAAAVLFVSFALANFGLFRRYLSEAVSETSIKLYPYHHLLYNAAQLRYLGPETATDVAISIAYTDGDGGQRRGPAEPLFDLRDSGLSHGVGPLFVLEHGDGVNFALPQRDLTGDGYATVIVRLVGAKSLREVCVRRDFELLK